MVKSNQWFMLSRFFSDSFVVCWLFVEVLEIFCGMFLKCDGKTWAAIVCLRFHVTMIRRLSYENANAYSPVRLVAAGFGVSGSVSI